jgi:hypothetical protein
MVYLKHTAHEDCAHSLDVINIIQNNNGIFASQFQGEPGQGLDLSEPAINVGRTLEADCATLCATGLEPMKRM